MLRRLFLATASAAALVLVTGSGWAAEVTLKIAHVAPPQAQFHINAEIFGKHLRKMSGGTMDIEIVPGGALGNLVQLWAQLKKGSLDMHTIDIGAILAMKDARFFFVITMPYLFKDQAHLHRFLDSDVFAGMNAKVEKATAIHFIGPNGDRPPRALSTRKTKVMTPADMKGMKIRPSPGSSRPGAPARRRSKAPSSTSRCRAAWSTARTTASTPSCRPA